jgi:hypothetical protein
MSKRGEIQAPRISERQAEYIAAVVRHNGNKSAVAREHGVSKQAVHDATGKPGAMAVLTQAMAERGLTAPVLARKIHELLDAQRAIAVNGPRGEGATLMYGPDGQTQLGAARLVSDVWERASRHAERVAERAERPDAALLERLTDEELLDALARRGRISRPASPPIEATSTTE